MNSEITIDGMIRLKDNGLLDNEQILDFIELEKRKKQMEEQDMHADFIKKHQYEPFFPQDQYPIEYKQEYKQGVDVHNPIKIKQPIVQAL